MRSSADAVGGKVNKCCRRWSAGRFGLRIHGMAWTYLKYPVLLAVASVLTACVVAPPVPVQGPGYEPAYGPWTYQSPPPPQVEYRGLAPGPTSIWIDGYWNWGGVRFQWVPGYWVAPPPGRVWVPPVWHRDGDRWRSEGGRWEQHAVPPAWSHREPVQPRPLPPPDIRPAPHWEPHPEPRPELHHEQPGPAAPYGALHDPRRPEAWQQRSGEPMLRPAPSAPTAGPWGAVREPDEGHHGPSRRRDGPPDGERDRDRDRR